MEIIKRKDLKRIPVIYKGMALMPTTQGRAYHLVKSGKGIFVKDKHLGWYLKLKKEPTGFHKQQIVLGIDTGTMFLGFSVVGNNISTNLEFEQTQKKLNKDYIKIHSSNRVMYRRMRRSRLCHREARFSNRTGHKITSTSNYIFQNIRNCVNWLFSLYPITDIVVEDVSFNHYVSTKGSSFSPIEQVKTRLYKFLRTKGNLIVSSSNPKKLRSFVNITTGEVKDLKEKDKAKKSFYAHCIDSHSLTQLAFDGLKYPFTEEITYLSRSKPGIDANRRKLSREKASQYGNNLVKRHHSKFRKTRTKENDCKSNHGPWKYLNNENYEEFTVEKTRSVYGSTWESKYRKGKLTGLSETQLERMKRIRKRNIHKGISKYEKYQYYDVQNFKTSKISPHLSYCLCE